LLADASAHPINSSIPHHLGARQRTRTGGREASSSRKFFTNAIDAKLPAIRLTIPATDRRRQAEKIGLKKNPLIEEDLTWRPETTAERQGHPGLRLSSPPRPARGAKGHGFLAPHCSSSSPPRPTRKNRGTPHPNSRRWPAATPLFRETVISLVIPNSFHLSKQRR
jgi:hypothetical protein